MLNVAWAPCYKRQVAAPGRKSPSLYEILGVGRSAGDEEIKRAYKALARRYHPDLNQNNPQAEAVFKSVTRAYEVLTDPDRRQQYDDALEQEEHSVEIAPKASRGPDMMFFVFAIFLVLAMLFFFVDTAKGTYFLVVAVALEIRTSIEALRSDLKRR